MNLFKHILILSFNSILLLIIFIFSFWLHHSSNKKLNQQVSQEMNKAQKITQNLYILKQKALSNQALAITLSPSLKSALQTQDFATIEDAIKSITKENNLNAVAISSDGEVVIIYPEPSKEKPNPFYNTIGGKAKIQNDMDQDLTLVIGSSPDNNLLESWAKISNTHYILTDSKNKLLSSTNNLTFSSKLNKTLTNTKKPNEVNLGGTNYYYSHYPIAGEKFKVFQFIEKNPFTVSLNKQRNSLLFLSGGLFFLGLLLSIVLAQILERKLSKTSTQFDPQTIQHLLDEVEEINSRKL